MNREVLDALTAERFAPPPRRHPTVSEAAPWRVAQLAADAWQLDDNEITTARRRRELAAIADEVWGARSGLDVDVEVG